jgi:general stress protein 26
MGQRWIFFGLVLAGILAWMPASQVMALTSEVEDALDSSKYVYIASTRKDGSLGRPAEIWYMHHQKAVWVATPKTTWRVKRIQAGRDDAKIWVGKSDGLSFMAKGSIVKDSEAQEALFKTFAEKYSSSWSSFETNFRNGLQNGDRLLIKYEPVE